MTIDLDKFEAKAIEDVKEYAPMYLEHKGKLLKGTKTYNGDFLDSDSERIISIPTSGRVWVERKKR